MSNIADIPIALVIIFVFIVTLVISVFLLDTFKNAFTDFGMGEYTSYLEKPRQTLLNFDNLLLLLIIGLGIASIISALFVRTHPVFFVVMLLAQLILIGIFAIFHDFYLAIMNNEYFASTAENFVWASFLISNFPMILLVFTTLLAIASYGLPVFINR